MLARVLCGGMVFKELLCSWCQPVCTFGFGLMVMKWRFSNYLLWKIFCCQFSPRIWPKSYSILTKFSLSQNVIFCKRLGINIKKHVLTPSQTIKNKVPQAQTSSAATRQKVSANKNFDSLNIQSRALIFNDPPGGDINNLYSKAPKTLIYPTHAFRLSKTKTYRVINATLFMLGPFHRMSGASCVWDKKNHFPPPNMHFRNEGKIKPN